MPPRKLLTGPASSGRLVCKPPGDRPEAESKQKPLSFIP
jgi:hypothetical protein